jgi:SAM-dependent methyltransferase
MSLINIDNFFYDIEFIDGVWKTRSNSDIVFYPKDGNNNFINIEDTSYWYIHRNSCIKQVIENYPPKKIIFDIGGGNGYVSLGIIETGNIPILIEPDIIGVNNAKKRGIVNVINSSFQSLNIKQNSMPSIGIFDVLEHIEKEQEFIQKIYNSLEIGGKLYITVPSYNLLWSNDDKNDGHFRRYTLNSLTKLLEKNNFKINYSTYFFTLLPFPIFIFRSIPTFFKFSKSNFEDEKKTHKLGIFKNLFNFFFKKELNYIKKHKKILFGGSIIIVAEKK